MSYDKVLNKIRNGCDSYVRHPLNRGFLYTDGVQELAECGCYWLIDILATEAAQALKKDQAGSEGSLGIVTMKVDGGKADVWMKTDDDAPPCWCKHIDLTDFPPGLRTLFYMQYDGEKVICILPSEY